MTHDAADTSASLLLRIRATEDEDAWSTFVAVYTPIVRRYCLRKGLQDADAADVCQEVMLKVSQAIRTFEYDRVRGRFRSWLGVITSNCIVTRFQRDQRKPMTGLPLDQESTDSEWNEEFTEHILNLALDRIRGDYSLDQWQLFEAVWIRREPATEIATRMGVAVHAVYVTKSRVLLHLQAEVLKLAEDFPVPEP
ncbi:MAG: RNA polymerase sigma factor [Fimbriiglobus sp.]